MVWKKYIFRFDHGLLPVDDGEILIDEKILKIMKVDGKENRLVPQDFYYRHS